MTTTLSPGYDPTQFEARLYAQWESSGAFAATGDGPAYSILLPPPNVTGTLHMGHAFQHTLQDALVRYHRMRGFRTLWQMGTDHAGIATEMVVARNLALEGQGETRDSLGRDGFIDRVWRWKGHSGDTIERQMRRLGTSGDWSRAMFTMDPLASDAVVEAFVRLYEQGLVYRGKRLVNWDPVLGTAISDLEVVNAEEDGSLWSIAYPLADGADYEHVVHDADGREVSRERRDYLVVATTRPETMLGDTAVMVHPDDARYAHLVGRSVTLPLTGRTIPIIADAYVDRAFGTGVVKVTPAHDFNDYAVGQRHGLPVINILTPAAKIIDSSSYRVRREGENPRDPILSLERDALPFDIGIPEKYCGLDRYDARAAIVADLDALGLLVETAPHKLQVPRGDRTGQAIEPFLTDQWFVKMDALAERGLARFEGRDDAAADIRFVPPNWINTYRHWMHNIQDWCISRQLWWGHRIPAWYDAQGNAHVGRDEADARARAGLSDDVALTRDADVLETWFSSGIWPISTMGWPGADAMRERGFADFVPSSVLVTGFDIIFFWVARMVMLTDALTGQVPFRDVYITGLVRDKEGQKMSKSKGNILDPLDIIDGIDLEALVSKRTAGLMNPKDAHKIERATRKDFPDGIPAFGADALRFTMVALAGPGRDIKFDLGRADGYRNFCNKLWNATRFVLMHTESLPVRTEDAAMPATDAEQWILARLARVEAQAAAHFAGYRFDLLAQALYEFAWNDFCDWFVELAKPALSGDDATAADSTRRTLLRVLEALLRLLHPLVPFVTEELWQQVAPRLGIAGDSISLQPYPAGDGDAAAYARAEGGVEWLRQMVSALRRIRSELGVSPARPVTLLLQGGSADDHARAARYATQLRFLNRIERIDTLVGEPPPAAAALVGDLRLYVPLEGLVDLDAERTRLDKELKRVSGELAKSQGKLASDTFVSNAPEAVVVQERQRLADWTAQRDALAAQRARL